MDFLNDNPGAVRYGNFINYYKFHPVQNRMKLIPKNIWKTDSIEEENEEYVCLDVGCNAGDLTIALHQFLQQFHICKFLGIDVDETLIKRARESNETIQFECLDVMNQNHSDFLQKYLLSVNKNVFNVSFCFSVTMWIHLNHGDDGLEKFFEKICAVTEMLVVEPQPWKCYKSAVKRLKQAGEEFPFYKQLKHRQNVETFIETLIENYNFHKVHETPNSEWGRRILFYKRK